LFFYAIGAGSIKPEMRHWRSKARFRQKLAHASPPCASARDDPARFMRDFRRAIFDAIPSMVLDVLAGSL
jgi:hypothetical protein